MKLKLINKIDESKDTKTFVFSSNEKFDWLAGQYIYITLPKLNYPDERGETRHFTISSSPTEKRIQITTRIRKKSGYKKTLDELPVGSIVEGRGPQGSFVFDGKDVKMPRSQVIQIFLAGGIGITPFRSMIKYNIDKRIKKSTAELGHIHLIYSNSDSDFVFKKELDTWQKQNNFLKIEYIDTSVLGRIDALKIKSFIENYKLKIENIVFWSVGPDVFVNAMEEALEELKIPEDNIKTEKFTGY